MSSLFGPAMSPGGTASVEPDRARYQLFGVLPDSRPDTADEASVAEALEACRAACMSHLEPHLDGYIWQRDPFQLEVVAASGARAASPAHLAGATAFGDNVEDEWFIVWLLVELTRAFPTLARASGTTTASFSSSSAPSTSPSGSSPRRSPIACGSTPASSTSSRPPSPPTSARGRDPRTRPIPTPPPWRRLCGSSAAATAFPPRTSDARSPRLPPATPFDVAWARTPTPRVPPPIAPSPSSPSDWRGCFGSSRSSWRPPSRLSTSGTPTACERRRGCDTSPPIKGPARSCR